VAEKQLSEWRQKHRGEVERGDAVWLDTERDLLISFFERFRTNIYGVWNYPQPAIEHNEQGTCLLRVTVNRDGTVREVELVESSGYPLLDREAMAAVRKGAPYGALPRSYESDSLTIFAFFQYRLGKRYLLGG
jgi:protein TonB